MDPLQDDHRIFNLFSNERGNNMAKAKLHPTIKGLSGKMGDVVFRYNKKTGKTSTSKVPDMSKVKWSKAQKAQRRRFKKAVAYVQGLKTKPAMWAVYQKIAKRKRKRAWDVAMKDFFQGSKLIANM
jgi:hypothetical protein